MNINGRERRRHQHPGKINEFLEDTSKESMMLPLYAREIRRLQYQFPQITITKDEPINNSDLWRCTITRKE